MHPVSGAPSSGPPFATTPIGSAHEMICGSAGSTERTPSASIASSLHVAE